MLHVSEFGLQVTRRPTRVLSPTVVLERRIRSKLQRHLLLLGFETRRDGSLSPVSQSKDSIRALHAAQRVERLQADEAFLEARGRSLLGAFADGRDVRPEAIEPRLQLVRSGTDEADLFRLASLLWSVPVSRGYGRRMRFLVWDRSNQKLIGLIALGDPSFNLRARDALIGWNSEQREQRLVNIMDAFVLGAVPPYNMLLGGKMVACLVRSHEVVKHFRDRYGDSEGLISGQQKKARLVAVTTSSSLGRSSIYNRLRLDGVSYFSPIGFTGGWGHFHVGQELFEDMRKYLKLRRHPYAYGYEYGDGPNWRMRTIRATLDLLGFDADMLRHGINREVFLCNVADNAGRILRGESHRPLYGSLKTVAQVGELATSRWMLPRALRDSSFSDWDARDLAPLLEWRLVADAASKARVGTRGA
jgi:hypothetical protein